MKIKFTWLLAGLVACCSAVAPAIAQATSLQSGLSVLVRTSTGLVALSNQGALLRSTNNGVNFTSIRAADSPRALFTVSASGTTVIAIGDSGNYVRSTNSGASYSASLVAAITPAFAGEIRSIAANGTTWVAVGYRGTSWAVIRSTDDGVTWAVATSVPTTSGKLNGVTWNGTRWVAVGETSLGGLILTSTDGNTWTQLTTTIDALYAVASDGAGKVLIGGELGSLYYATDAAATAGSFTSVGNNLVSDSIRAVAFLSGSSWVAGGDSAVRLTFNGTTSTPTLASGPDTNSGGAPLTAFAWTGTNADHYFSPPPSVTPTPHGPISLTITQSVGQLHLTLVGAESGNSYYLESTINLSTWATVVGSPQNYTGGAAPTWTYSLPGAGGRIFYRAKSGTPAF